MMVEGERRNGGMGEWEDWEDWEEWVEWVEWVETWGEEGSLGWVGLRLGFRQERRIRPILPANRLDSTGNDVARPSASE
uniref:Uncharacterized protein n=1 Tax=Vespula pensylvanica TaxID=30213 RepID=A0A834N611_VESPE|nr:hypothetical protein H0235_016577 [Vespula pensylvanica]